MRILATLAIGGIVAVVLAWIGRGQLVHQFLVGGAFVLIAFPCAAFGIVLTMVSRRPFVTRVGRLLNALALLIAMQLLSLPVGAYLGGSDVRDARAFCDRLASELDREREAAGIYPVTLGERVPDVSAVPRLLRDKNIYVSDGRSFVLSFTERNAVVPRTHLYSSELRVWISF